jgi:hypothetical protein
MKTAHQVRNRCYYSILSILLSGYLFPPACNAASFAGGTGEPNDPYQVATAEDLASIGSDPNLLYKHFHFVLVADIDLAGKTWSKAVIPEFWGEFDGNSLAIRNLTITGEGYLGLFGMLYGDARIRDLDVLDVDVEGSDLPVGGIAGQSSGIITFCHSTGTVKGASAVGGLVGRNQGGQISSSPSTIRGILIGTWAWRASGGLVGENNGSVIYCFSDGEISGSGSIGGLVGLNGGNVMDCYSTGQVSGSGSIGGLIGINKTRSSVIHCYSTGGVIGIGTQVGGLVGKMEFSSVGNGFWDIQTSGQSTSAIGIGLTTAQMCQQESFIGWDFIGETDNGTQDIWVMPANSYPRLAWELAE